MFLSRQNNLTFYTDHGSDIAVLSEELQGHYSDVIMNTLASKITGVSIVF